MKVRATITIELSKPFNKDEKAFLRDYIHDAVKEWKGGLHPDAESSCIKKVGVSAVKTVGHTSEQASRAGKARMQLLSPLERRRIAQHAARARWDKAKKE